jgi:hypothetical protein
MTRSQNNPTNSPALETLPSVANRFELAPEPFVDAEKAAIFLDLTPRRLQELAREGKLPAHPLGDGLRRRWRFRLTELASSMQARLNCNRQFPAPNERAN